MNVTYTPTATTTSMNETCVKIEDSPVSDFLMAVYILAFIFGLTFNVLTLYPIWQQVRQQNVLGIFLLSLSISDLLFIFTMPLWINYYRMDHNWRLGVTSCSVAGFFYYSNMYISIYLLCCISVDRSLVVSYPLHFKHHRTSRYAWIQCATVYVAVMTMHIVILIFDNLKDVHDDTNNNDRCYETYPMESSVALFNMIRMGFGFMLPLLVLGVSYWRVLATVGKSPGLNVHAKRKVRLLSFGVIGIFSVCFAPYHILLFARSLVFFNVSDRTAKGYYCEFENNMHFTFSCTLALSSLNCVVDPVLYVLVSDGVKDTWKLCWRRPEHKGTEDCKLTSYNREKPHDRALI
ncbi:G protein-coupled receptor 184 [Girardinichthys multiradiatus]|uniref:G protein-coupled receptor 184 n=1 Tax=Girardinichthys multiradiatus TaxID=208333 RepID=UPI001FAE742F|nr:G protein-coupled receptor 184 [Girardinichthys multiradiatus]XP_047248100.1 G protein-coupled receptor 184 [Girardinichthys multiradiatus]XP_047248101.1 G protein-coupled receptor 184 [Girardinichthys multiradiatus]